MVRQTGLSASIIALCLLVTAQSADANDNGFSIDWEKATATLSSVDRWEQEHGWKSTRYWISAIPGSRIPIETGAGKRPRPVVWSRWYSGSRIEQDSVTLTWDTYWSNELAIQEQYNLDQARVYRVH